MGDRAEVEWKLQIETFAAQSAAAWKISHWKSIRSIWFTDEKSFTVSTPIDHQNDHLYSAELKKSQAPERRIIHEWEHFSRSIMVSVSVSWMGNTSVVFVEPGAKVNSEYYCDHVLKQGLLHDIQAKCSRHNWTLHRTEHHLLQPETLLPFCIRRMSPSLSQTFGHQTVQILNPVNYAIWGALQEKVYLRQKFTTVDQLQLAIVKEWRKLS